VEYAPEPTADELAVLAGELVSGGEVSISRRIPGGVGCTMDVLRLRDGSGVESQIVLRRRGAWSRDNTIDAARAEFELLEHLLKHDLPVPKPVWLDEKRIFKEPALVMSFLPGRPLMTPDDPIDYASQLARMLATLHAVPVSEKVLPGLRDYNAIEVAHLGAPGPPERMRAHHLGVELWRRQRSELERLEITGNTLLHGDYWPGNTLWQGQRVTAVVDFEEAGIGDPALDVATAVVNLKYEPWPGAAERFIDVYKAETGRSLDSLLFWSMKELARPMPDIARWLPSFNEISSRSEITVEEL
jgi:aminoglycoside phosphotransferase (APT) family kinase protein